MEIIIGLLIIAVGAFCQSSSYVPINKVKGWSWESYWLVQGNEREKGKYHPSIINSFGLTDLLNPWTTF